MPLEITTTADFTWATFNYQYFFFTTPGVRSSTETVSDKMFYAVAYDLIAKCQINVTKLFSYINKRFCNVFVMFN